MAGREVLIKAVIQSIPTYVMSCFRLPGSVIDEIEKIVRKFWWAGAKSAGIHWLPWSNLCGTKSSGGIGFRDLECFNTALLAKQAWRLVTEPNSLLAQILKAKYYPRESFFTAELGDRPSLTWRSVLSARRALASGLKMRVGNGAKTSIWGDSWLLSSFPGRIITSRPPDSNFPNTVADLINWERGEWNYELLEATFWQVDIPSILQVPIGAQETEDRLVWAFSKSGNFTVRSCYHHLIEEGEETQLGGTRADSALWKWIWRLETPPKIRSFIWRACHEILPTKAALVRRHVGTNPYCSMCNRSAETEAHLFFECAIFGSIWTAAPFNLQQGVQASNFRSGLSWLRLKLDPGTFALACVTIWNMWNYRNGREHGREWGELDQIVSRSHDFLSSLASARIHFQVPSQTMLPATWTPPVEGVVKFNFDAAIFQDGFFQLGVVARDSDGRCLRWVVKKKRGSVSPEIAEAQAARLSIELAKEMALDAVQIEGDCMVVINAINDRNGDNLRPFGAIIQSCQLLSSSFASFSCSFIRRTGNCFAHALSHFHCSDCDVLEGVSPPATLAHLI